VEAKKRQAYPYAALSREKSKNGGFGNHKAQWK
jgi:hypothetical protein